MTRIESTIEIAAGAADVFVFFVPQRMAYWYGKEMGAELEVQGGAAEFQVSQKIRVAGKIGKRDVGHTAVITRYEWGRAMEWKFQDRYGVKGLERWEITVDSAALTRVRMISEYEMPNAIGRIVDRLFTRQGVERRNEMYLARLKKLAERK
jgi:Polyketide cyclase / dehydrase and lipid transport